MQVCGLSCIQKQKQICKSFGNLQPVAPAVHLLVCVCACLEYRLQKKTSVKPACYISIPKLVLVDVLRVLWTGRATTQGNSDPLPMPHFVLVDAVKMVECQGNS